MTAAIFGLLGVVAGGLITFFTQLRLLGRQERARTRAAARVIHSELLTLTAIVGLQQLESQVRLDPTRLLATWQEHRNDLARLDLEDWYTLATVVATATMSEQLEGIPGGVVAGPALIKQLTEAREALEPTIAGTARRQRLIRSLPWRRER